MSVLFLSVMGSGTWIVLAWGGVVGLDLGEGGLGGIKGVLVTLLVNAI